MIKLKIYNPEINSKFECKIINWLLTHRIDLNNIGIDVSYDYKSYDYILISTKWLDFRDVSDFEVSKKKSYSIIDGLDNIILTDDNDNSSMFGYRHLISDNRIKYVLKSFLMSRIDYLNPTVFGGIKHYIDEKHPHYTGYTFTDVEWNKIKLSGIDIGFYPNWNYPGKFKPDSQTYANKRIDVFAVFQGVHRGRKFYNQEIGRYYTEHRTKCWYEINKVRRNCVSGMISDLNITNDLHKLSKITVSPFGMGEYCFRDFEAIFHLSVIIKPDVSHVQTLINYFKPYENYIPCNVDYSDVNEKIDKVLSDENLRTNLVENAFNSFHQKYDKNIVIQHLKNTII